jgi:hypothetical protein
MPSKDSVERARHNLRRLHRQAQRDLAELRLVEPEELSPEQRADLAHDLLIVNGGGGLL